MRVNRCYIDSAKPEKASFKFNVQVLLCAILTCAFLALTACTTGSPSRASGDRADATHGDINKPAAIAPVHQEETVRQKESIISNGTLLSVRLLHTVSSRTARPGDKFEAELISPIEVGGKTLFPMNARVSGRVVTVRKSGRLKDPGFLQLSLDSIQSSSGQWISIETAPVSAVGESHTKRNATLIGGGAGVGAIIGAIIGKGKGAAIGAGVGAAGGTAGAYSTGVKEASFGAETRLTFKMTRESPVKV